MTATAELKLAMRQTRLRRTWKRLEERAIRALQAWANVPFDASARSAKAKAKTEELMRAAAVLKDELREVTRELDTLRAGRAA